MGKYVYIREIFGIIPLKFMEYGSFKSSAYRCNMSACACFCCFQNEQAVIKMFSQKNDSLLINAWENVNTDCQKQAI